MKQYVIFGMSYLCKWLINDIGAKKIYCIIDNNSSLWGEYWNGVPILSLDEYRNKDKYCEIVIASIRYYKEIQAQLIQNKIFNIVSVTKVWCECKIEKKSYSRIFLMNTHSYTNGGDYFITLAEKKYIFQYFEKYEMVLIPSMVCADSVKDFKEVINKNDLILITGGGYLGNLWMEYGENNVREIISYFSDNRIIILPQSLYFTNDYEGFKESLKTSKIYKEHNRLTVCLREEKSLNVANKLFKQEQILFLPDVTLLYCADKKKKRIGIATCFREDKESCLTAEEQKFLNQILYKKSKLIVNFRMEVDELLTEEEAEQAVIDKLEQISGYQMVVTDRLHCMIMCLVTGTPCIVFDNLSGKISGTYNLIGRNDYIKMLTKLEGIEMALDDLLLRKTDNKYNNDKIEKCYKQLTELIINTWEIM